MPDYIIHSLQLADVWQGSKEGNCFPNMCWIRLTESYQEGENETYTNFKKPPPPLREGPNTPFHDQQKILSNALSVACYNKKHMFNFRFWLAARKPQTPPIITHAPANKTAYPGQDIELECRIISDAQPHLQWVKHKKVNGSWVDENNIPYVDIIQVWKISDHGGSNNNVQSPLPPSVVWMQECMVKLLQ